MKTFRIVISALALAMAALFVWLWFAVGEEGKLIAEQPWGVPFTLTAVGVLSV